MSKNGVGAPPSYSNVLPQSAPPSYAEAIGGVKPSSPFTPQVMNQTTILTTVVPIGPNPTHMICPSCNAEIETSIKKTPSVMAWVSGLVIALMGCWLGCCLIPCAIESCLDVEHTCPNCNSYLGKHRR